ncbi:AMP-binding protein [Gallalistipes aquisgranensis]|uniref:AMP-binding protein n=1 Tax=Gallalistipes aquisgranensis TaxID=2779358 RepID=UPI001CF9044A|nr:AMP-binding protein [Gallalistipes aquisgranensis]MBE5033784.1 AMP-binding protein [Gallalistipes aquisgranensis]
MLQENVIKIYENSFRENRELPALTDYFKKETFSYYEMAKEIAKLHLLFAECRIRKGDRIALIGRNNPRWVIAYIATITYGAVIVPILQDFNANDVHHIINHSGSQLLFVGDVYWDMIETGQIEEVKAVFSLTDYHCLFERRGQSIARFQSNIVKHYRKRYRNGFRPEDIAYPEIPNDRLCVLNYTSGTTGFSKGVMLTVNNITGNVVFGIGQKLHFRRSRVLSFLPLAHAYGCAFDLLVPLAQGTHITLLGRIPSPKILVEAMSEVKPHLICCVPLILEKVYKKQILPILGNGILKMALRIPLLDQKVYNRIRRKLMDAFGGEFEQIIVGGAPFNHEVEEFLLRIRFPFTVGYGMTECGPLVSYTHWTEYKSTSCGKVLPGLMEARIESEDPRNVPGEILVRGEHVMAGYYKNEKATSDVMESDGWMRTGDVGTLDEDGTLYIRGRNKTMILGPSGQNIYPEEIEAKLNNLYCVMESLVVEREGKLVALVCPDYEQADADGISHAKLPEVMEENLKTLNTLVAPYERVSGIVLYPNEFEKTPKRSIKRYLYNV